jgi:hypothetical protein
MNAILRNITRCVIPDLPRPAKLGEVGIGDPEIICIDSHPRSESRTSFHGNDKVGFANF